jgi:chromate reductase
VRRLLAISGSLRSGSYNTALLRAAAAERSPDVEFVHWTGLAGMPAYDEDIDTLPPPRPVAELRAEIERSGAMLIATPEYNSSLPGALKNALDWMSRPYPGNVLRRKRIAVIGASTGLFGALAAQAELRKVLKAIGADVLDVALSVPAAHSAFTADGRPRDRELTRALRAIVDDLVREPAERAA